MADKTISQLTEATSLVDADLLVLTQASSGITKKMTAANFKIYAGGADGAAGQGVPTGGTTGQYLVKNSNTNYDTTWYTLNLAAYATLANPTFTGTVVLPSSTSLTTPKVVTSINDTNGNELLVVTATASAVNELTLANAATGNSPSLIPSGETNVGLDLRMKGTGVFRKPVVIGIQVVDAATDTAVGDGKAFFRIPAELNGMNLTGVAMTVYTAGTTNTTDVQIRNKTDTADMLSTKLTIDSGETDTSTAATPAVINTATDDVVTGDVIAVDVDAVSTTAAKGLYIQLKFELP